MNKTVRKKKKYTKEKRKNKSRKYYKSRRHNNNKRKLVNKYYKKRKGGNNDKHVIDIYLSDLYKESIMPDFEQCKFACDVKKDPKNPFSVDEQYRRAELDNKKCPGTDAHDNYNPKNYFHTLKEQGNPYFKTSYDKYFGIDYETNIESKKEWNRLKFIVISMAKTSFDINKKDKTIIILGPAELLYPFSSDPQFHALSHGDWTPNVNFNYIIDVLCKKGEFFFVLPTGATNKSISSYETKIEQKDRNRFSLASDCKQFVRATLSELLIVKELEEKKLVTVTKIISDKFVIPNIHIESYELVILHVVSDKVKLCTDHDFLKYEIDYSK
jgi:hypothetical protein